MTPVFLVLFVLLGQNFFMKTFPFSKIRSLLVALSVSIIIGGIGYRLGERHTALTVTLEQKVVIRQDPPPTTAVDFSLFWDVWQRLHRYYIEPVALDTQKMVYGAISGMVNAIGDPYTSFLPPKENQEFKEELGGAFEGIGAQLELKNGRVSVVAPLKGTPAEKAGIRPGDILLKVNDEDTTGWTVANAVGKIRGPRGTSVALTVFHEGEQKTEDLAIVRETITVPSVESWVKTVGEIEEISAMATTSASLRVHQEEMIAYLRLTRFGDHSNEQWQAAVAAIVAAQKAGKRIRGLVFDLRNNPGGYLDGAVYIASEFLKNGIVVSQVNSDSTREDYPVDRKGSLLDIPVVVLVNRGSASASEIVAGALKDYGRAKIVGETTYGKGTVQTPQDLKGGASIHITTGKWLLPKGASISKVGIKPDVEVLMEPTADLTHADAQLAKAIELLLQ